MSNITELGEACKIVTQAYKNESWFRVAFHDSIVTALKELDETTRLSPTHYYSARKIAERIFDLSDTQDSIIKKAIANYHEARQDESAVEIANKSCETCGNNVQDECVAENVCGTTLAGWKPKTSAILDSGNRTEFASGAVRDIQKGKGRPSLMPLDIVAFCLKSKDDPMPTDAVLGSLGNYVKSGSVIDLKQAITHFCRKADKSVAAMMLEVSVHFEQGAEKYGVDNWKKGIDESSYIDSAVRHYLKWLDGWDDERHDRAFVWNVMCLWWTHENITQKDSRYAELAEMFGETVKPIYIPADKITAGTMPGGDFKF